MPFDPRKRPLTTHEARVLGTLMEKARTVPDSYPLTLNSLVLGCNQKTSREPVMELSEAQVQDAIDSLAQINLSTEAYGSRAKRYGQQFQRIAGVTEPQSVIVGLLLLRGPQTVAELRINSDRWYKFADNGAVEEVLNGLVAFDEHTETGRNPTHGAPLVVQLPKAAGSREARWMHLLSGEVDPNLMSSSSAPLVSSSLSSSSLGSSISHSPAPSGTAAHTIASLEARVTELEAIVAHIQTELGLKITPKE